jgi:LmbE family N-acetylglucosaminyl deacetylase
VTVLVLSAHLDDAVLSCGGRLGPGSTVVTLFAGRPPGGTLAAWDALTGAEDSAERVDLRWEEDRRALALVGAQGVRLPLLDDQYRTTAPDPATVLPLLAPVVDRARALWLPAAVGSHPDHCLTRAVGLLLAQDTGLPTHLYADLPYAFPDGWPVEVTSGRSTRPVSPDTTWPAEATLLREATALLPRPATLVRRVFRLSPRATALKRAAVAAYASQVPVLDEHCRGRLRGGRDLGVEVAWDLVTVPRSVPGGP